MEQESNSLFGIPFFVSITYLENNNNYHSDSSPATNI